jgi:flagellar basal-body rod protein FlgF
MDAGLYLASSGLVARLRALEITAQDLANVNTTAYRGSQAGFQAVLARGQEQGLSVAARAVNQHSVVDGTTINFAQGQLKETGNPLDLGIEGTAFVEIEAPAGIRYTRNGNFRVSPDGILITQDGFKVKGESGDITVPPGKISIGADGTISVNGSLSGKLKLVEFDRPDQLVRQGESMFSAPTAAAHKARHSTVRQGMLEGANVNAVEATVGLMTLQRHAEMLQRAMSAFHSEFNRAAVEELPKV